MTDLRRSKCRRLLHTGAGLALVALLGSPSLGSSARATPVEPTLAIAGELAAAVGARVTRRIEALRDPAVVQMSSVDLDVRFGSVDADRTLDPFLAEPDTLSPPLLLGDGFEWRPVPQRELAVRRRTMSDGSADLWGNGTLEFGRSEDGMVAPSASSADVATGIDMSLSRSVSLGASVAYNRSNGPDVGTLSLPSLSTYGSLALGADSFLDLAAGFGLLQNEASSQPGSMQGGEAGFVTATFGNRQRIGAIGVSPYARLETTLVRAGFGSSAETGARVLASRTSGVAGLKTDFVWKYQGATLAPALRMELSRELSRTQSIGAQARQQVTIAPEIGAEFAPGWTARVEHRSRFEARHFTRSVELKLQATF